jgi:hypothetical protein
LFLGANAIQDEGAKAVGEAIKAHASLKELFIGRRIAKFNRG